MHSVTYMLAECDKQLAAWTLVNPSFCFHTWDDKYKISYT